MKNTSHNHFLSFIRAQVNPRLQVKLSLLDKTIGRFCIFLDRKIGFRAGVKSFYEQRFNSRVEVEIGIRKMKLTTITYNEK